MSATSGPRATVAGPPEEQDLVVFQLMTCREVKVPKGLGLPNGTGAPTLR